MSLGAMSKFCKFRKFRKFRKSVSPACVTLDADLESLTYGTYGTY